MARSLVLLPSEFLITSPNAATRGASSCKTKRIEKSILIYYGKARNSME
jgi:hypothetical protein